MHLLLYSGVSIPLNSRFSLMPQNPSAFYTVQCKKKYSFYHVKFTYFSIMSTGFRSRLCTLGDLKNVHAVLSVRVAEKRETEQLLYRGVASFNNLCHIKNTFHTRSFKRDFGGMQSLSLCSKTKLPRFNSAACSNFILYTHQLLKHSSC